MDARRQAARAEASLAGPGSPAPDEPLDLDLDQGWNPLFRENAVDIEEIPED